MPSKPAFEDFWLALRLFLAKMTAPKVDEIVALRYLTILRFADAFGAKTS